MKWISIKDRLPDKPNPNGITQICLVSGIQDGERYVHYAEIYAYGNNGDCFSIPGWSDMNVTHWMPLPKPPKK